MRRACPQALPANPSMSNPKKTRELEREVKRKRKGPIQEGELTANFGPPPPTQPNLLNFGFCLFSQSGKAKRPWNLVRLREFKSLAIWDL